MPGPLHVLFVEDSVNDAELLLIELRRAGMEIEHRRIDTGAAMKDALEAGPWDVIIADYSLPQFSGLAALAMVQAKGFDVPFILVSGAVGEEAAVQAMKAGAHDYLFKGNLQRLAPAVKREIREADERRTARHTKKQLEISEVHYRRLFETAHDGILMLDAQTGKVLDVNRFMLDLLQYPIEHFLGKALWEIGIFRDIEANMAAMTVLQQQGSIRYEDLPLQARNGRCIPVEFVGNVYYEGEFNVIQCNIRDITERRRADKEIEKAKMEAEAANRAKSEFLANMSHEIRTPMTAIMGFADIILQPALPDTDRVECVQIIRRNSIYLLELINGILDLSKIEGGLMTVERIPCEIPALLTDVVAIARPRAAEKGLQFELLIKCPIPRFVQTDPMRLRQILVNLLGNAIKFTPVGKITLTIGCERPERGNMLCIEVADSGIGMTPEQLARLFRPFSQADESITRKFGGTGLGLTISRQLAKLLGGDVEVKSELGVGSTFTLRVDCGSIAGVEMLTDLNEASLPTTAPGEIWQDIPLRGRILLVDDGRDNQRLVSMHLRAAGAEVVIADNGQIAVDIMGKNSFDLVLMDMQMPVMDGYAATAELRRQRFTTPVIALTANAMAEDRKKCLASGCTDYMSKPIDRDILLKTVRQYLGMAPTATPPTPSVAARITDLSVTRVGATTIIKSSMMEYPGMRAIIAEFVDGLPAEVRKMAGFLAERDMVSLRRVVHQLRGSGGGYGFDSLTEPTTNAERSIAACSTLPSIAAEIKTLIDVIRRIEGYDEVMEKLNAQALAA